MSKLQKEQDSGYSAQSEHFHNTRKKWWPEVEHLKASLSWWKRVKWNPEFSFVDLWCWAWRLSEIIGSEFPDYSYTGVDSAKGMVEQAAKTHKTYTFVNDDMITHMSNQKQESLDCIVALASFQHVQWKENHLLLLSHIYKSLNRGGRCYLVNWSYSDWFLKKYWKNTLKAVLRSLTTRWRAWNDLVIPWKDKSFQQNWIKFDRMYHMFTVAELENCAKTAGFVVKEWVYIGQDWQKTSHWRKARNSFVVLEKWVE